MNTSQYINARNAFFSDLESVSTLEMTSPDITTDVTLQLKDIRALSSYLSAVHLMEPLFGATNNFIDYDLPYEDESLSFEAFRNTTLLNNVKTFVFQATTFANKVPLVFYDKALLGETNVYKPFGSSESTSIKTMMTSSIAGAAAFSSKNFKLAHYKGLVAFSSTRIHNKGYVINITDRGFKIVIIAAKYDLKKGVATYLGLLISKA